MAPFTSSFWVVHVRPYNYLSLLFSPPWTWVFAADSASKPPLISKIYFPLIFFLKFNLKYVCIWIWIRIWIWICPSLSIQLSSLSCNCGKGTAFIKLVVEPVSPSNINTCLIFFNYPRIQHHEFGHVHDLPNLVSTCTAIYFIVSSHLKVLSFGHKFFIIIVWLLPHHHSLYGFINFT